MTDSNLPKKVETKKENKFDWADEGLSALVRVVICLLYTSDAADE